MCKFLIEKVINKKKELSLPFNVKNKKTNENSKLQLPNR